MARVTIEGSVSPSTHLPRGERRIVERTDFIDKLVRGGFVNILEYHEDPAPAVDASPATPPKRTRRARTPKTEEDDAG
jgi:hypothetical protein